MAPHRREVLALTGGVAVGTLGGCLGGCDGVACFEHVHEGADDALDNLTVTHDGGRPLPAREVYLTGVASEYPPDPEHGQTKPWHELDDSFGPDDDVSEGDSIRGEIGFVNSVAVLWRRDGTEETLERFELY